MGHCQGSARASGSFRGKGPLIATMAGISTETRESGADMEQDGGLYSLSAPVPAMSRAGAPRLSNATAEYS